MSIDGKPQEAQVGHAKEKPRFADPTDYEDDFYLWSYEQAELVRQRRFSELDLPNLVEELESMGKETRHTLESSYRLLTSHLLKWVHQPQLRSRSWKGTIVRERANIERREKTSPSLAAEAPRLVESAYRHARREAAAETDLPLGTFPTECPFTLEQLRDLDFMPA